MATRIFQCDPDTFDGVGALHHVGIGRTLRWHASTATEIGDVVYIFLSKGKRNEYPGIIAKCVVTEKARLCEPDELTIGFWKTPWRLKLRATIKVLDLGFIGKNFLLQHETLSGLSALKGVRGSYFNVKEHEEGDLAALFDIKKQEPLPEFTYNNPTVGGGGYDPDKPGQFYCLSVLLANGQRLVKFGISNKYKRRLGEHKETLDQVDAQFDIETVAYFDNGYKCRDFETSLKRQYKPYLTKIENCAGFQSECFDALILPDLLAMLANCKN